VAALCDPLGKLRAVLRCGVAVVATGLAGGCSATRAVLDTARGHDSSGPPPSFALELLEAFLLPEGGILLYGRDRGTGGGEAWIVELASGSAEVVPGGTLTGASHRIDVRRAERP